jgi:(p)ppGpp synthase/HD superfamily hydrolase
MIDFAIEVAARAHSSQTRKSTDISYITHPFSVAIILSQAGCSEEVIVAGILHDTVEDTSITLEYIRENFGKNVASVIEGCSEPDKSLPWKERKKHTIEFLKNAPLEVRLVACADKLNNIRTIASDYEKIGDKIWERFNEKRKEEQKWYYMGIVECLCEQPDTKNLAIFQQLKQEVETFFDKIRSK